MPRTHKWVEAEMEPGRIVCRDPDESGPSIPGASSGFFCKWLYKIGWALGREAPHHLVLVCMTDGMVHEAMTAAEMVKWMTENRMIPCRESWFRIACKSMPNTLRFAVARDDADGDWSKDHPVFSIEDWRGEASRGDTVLGYSEWVSHKLEDQSNHLYVGCPVEVFAKPDDPFSAGFIGRIQGLSGSFGQGDLVISVGYSNQDDGDVCWDVGPDQIQILDE
jgi:hypothetical protein